MLLAVNAYALVPVAGGGLERDGHVPLVDVDQLVLVDPAVAPDPVVVELHLVLGALDQLHLAEAVTFDPRTLLPVLLGEVGLPDVGRLHHVVVNADDLRDVHARDDIA